MWYNVKYGQLVRPLIRKSDQFKHSGSHTILVLGRRQYRKFDVKNDHQTKRNSTIQNHSNELYDKAQRYNKTLS